MAQGPQSSWKRRIVGSVALKVVLRETEYGCVVVASLELIDRLVLDCSSWSMVARDGVRGCWVTRVTLASGAWWRCRVSEVSQDDPKSQGVVGETGVSRGGSRGWWWSVG